MIRPLFSAVMLALCAAAAPPNGGTISVAPVAGEAGSEPVGPEVADGVGEALGARGFTMLNDAGHSAYIAEVTLRQTEVGTGTAKIAKGKAFAAPGLFGAAGGGVTVPLGGGKTREVTLTRFQLDLRIVRRSTTAVVWRGSAITVRPAEPGTGRAVAAALGEAMLRSYPYEPREVVSVR